MNPVPSTRAIVFTEWLRRSHPELREPQSLESLSKEELFELTIDFHRSTGLFIDKSLHQELCWNYRAKNETDWRRYLRVPNHAMFLFTSEDDALNQYIQNHWKALDRLTGNACDCSSCYST